jgi:hypothetical protein
MTDYLFTHFRDIDRALLSEMMTGDKGQAKLEVKAYYAKDRHPRGIYVGCYRTLETDFGLSYDLMNRHNGSVCIATMDRKPSPKVAAQWVSTIGAKLDQIADIALESDAPDWKKVRDLFSFITG